MFEIYHSYENQVREDEYARDESQPLRRSEPQIKTGRNRKCQDQEGAWISLPSTFTAVVEKQIIDPFTRMPACLVLTYREVKTLKMRKLI
jgi:hypothetical protein